MNLKLIFLFCLDYFKRIKKYLKTKRCRNNRHIKGNWYLIEKVPTGDWGEPINNTQVRDVTYKLKCSHCDTVFMDKNRWEHRSIDY